MRHVYWSRHAYNRSTCLLLVGNFLLTDLRIKQPINTYPVTRDEIGADGLKIYYPTPFWYCPPTHQEA
jgi:hypothetical protein